MSDLFGFAGEERLVNTVTAGDQFAPRIAKLASGGYVVLWTDASQQTDASGGGIVGQLYDASGEKVGGEFLVNGTTAGEQSGVGVTGLANGGFVATWGSASGPAMQVFDAAGGKVGGEQIIETPATDAVPQVVGLSGGGFVVILPTGIGQIFDDDGTTVGSFDFDNRFTNGVIAALPDGGFVIASREDFDGIILRRYDADGTLTGEPVAFGDYWVSAGEMAIEALPNGGFVVAWTNTYGGGEIVPVFAQMFGPDGLPVGAIISVAGYTAEHSQPRVAALSDGGFVIS